MYVVRVEGEEQNGGAETRGDKQQPPGEGRGNQSINQSINLQVRFFEDAAQSEIDRLNLGISLAFFCRPTAKLFIPGPHVNADSRSKCLQPNTESFQFGRFPLRNASYNGNAELMRRVKFIDLSEWIGMDPRNDADFVTLTGA